MKIRPTLTLPKGEGEKAVSPPSLLGRGQGGGAVFFGTDEFAVIILEELKAAGLTPSLIITAPDRPRGKKLILTPPLVKIWAQVNGIKFLQPASLKTLDVSTSYKLKAISYKLFLVASYGKIIPQSILDLPRHGTLNVHPSLLPKYRGPAPIQATILNGDTETGVTIMLLDEQVDHGPTLKAVSFQLLAFSFKYEGLRNKLAHLGGKLLAETIPDWLAGKIKPVEQDHTKATFTKMIKKEDGLIDFADLAAKPLETYRKFLAYQPWPGIYFFEPAGSSRAKSKDHRVKIVTAHPDSSLGGLASKLVLDRVIPEGGKEMTWEAYRHGQTPLAQHIFNDR